jgi:AraC-like DNA-binding protein
MNPVKRESPISSRPFPFELLHTDGPANNMRLFHWHDFMEISYVTRGTGRYEIEEKAFTVRAGDIVIINNIERHRVTYHPADPLYETVMHFAPDLLCARDAGGLDARYLRLFLHDGASFSNKPELQGRTRAEVKRLVSEIRGEYRDRRPWHELMIKARLLTLVTCLMRECRVSEAGDPQMLAVRKKNIARLERILAYVRKSFREEIHLDDIAERFSMNPSYFSDYFRRNLGITFREFLAQARVQEALRLLEEDRMTITEIAFACGFNTTAGFYAAFKKVTGRRPGDYRNPKRIEQNPKEQDARGPGRVI